MFLQNSQNCSCRPMVSATTTPVQRYDLVSTMLVLGTKHQPTAALMAPF